MKKITLIVLAIINFNCYAGYNHDTRTYTLEDEIIFRVKGFSNYDLPRESSYCKDYASSETLPKQADNLIFNHEYLCTATMRGLAIQLSMLKTNCKINTNDELLTALAGGGKPLPSVCKLMDTIKEINGLFSKMEEYNSLVLTQRKLKREEAQKQQIEVAMQQKEKEAKRKLEKDNSCKNELKSIVTQDKTSLSSYDTNVAELEKTIQDENWRYARALINDINKPSLLIKKANDYCFKLSSFQQHEEESNKQINLINNRLKTEIVKIKENQKIEIEKNRDIKEKSPDEPKPIKQVKAESAKIKPISNKTSAEGKYLKNESLICFSESSYENQTGLLVAGIMEYADGCLSSSGGRQKVKLLDLSWSGRCIVERFSDNRKLWVDCESIL